GGAGGGTAGSGGLGGAGSGGGTVSGVGAGISNRRSTLLVSLIVAIFRSRPLVFTMNGEAFGNRHSPRTEVSTHAPRQRRAARGHCRPTGMVIAFRGRRTPAVAKG